jgi:hypothetical protein
MYIAPKYNEENSHSNSGPVKGNLLRAMARPPSQLVLDRLRTFSSVGDIVTRSDKVRS